MNTLRVDGSDAFPDYTDQWEAVRVEVANLTEYGHDWNGEGALPVRPGLIDAAFQFLLFAEQSNPPPADVYLAPDGTVIMEWHPKPGFVTIANIRVPHQVELIYRQSGVQPIFIVEPIPSLGGASDGRSSVPSCGPNEPPSCLDDDSYKLAA